MERIGVVNRRELRDLTGEHSNRNISVSRRVEIENTSRTTLCLSSTLCRNVGREGYAAHMFTLASRSVASVSLDLRPLENLRYPLTDTS